MARRARGAGERHGYGAFADSQPAYDILGVEWMSRVGFEMGRRLDFAALQLVGSPPYTGAMTQDKDDTMDDG